jgi:hypothetical protein
MLTEQEIARIREEEAVRVETQKNIAGPKQKKGFWDFLNSQFALWLLGSVVLSGITYYWNHRNDQRVAEQKLQQSSVDKQREDSQFLATLLPYLTNPDVNVRLRAQDVILARYPENNVPPQIQILIANCLFRETTIPDAQKSTEAKQLLATVDTTLTRVQTSTADQALASLLPAAQSANQQHPITVNYFPKEVDQIDFQELSESFRRAGFNPQQLASGGKNPDLQTNAVWAADDVPVAQAKFVALLLMQTGLKIRALRRFKPDAQGGVRKPGTIEIGSDRAFLNGPPLTVKQVIDLTDLPKRQN